MKYAHLSRRFKQALKLHPEPAYKIAWRHNTNPNMLSKFVSGYVRPRADDTRLIAIGKELGLAPEECFEIVTEEPPHQSAAATA